jgi:GTP-binding protein
VSNEVSKLRNIAIIAHVDHGKTTLVDRLFTMTGSLKSSSQAVERVMDSNDQEKERGITILAKNTAIEWQDYRINIVDTPGHADFGGEVERIMSMVDGVLLLVDAVEGPMPQTRFVTQKAFAQGLKPILVINKIDRPGARPDWVMDQVFDLFDRLGATDEQLDFPVIYASALSGIAGFEIDEMAEDMTPLLTAVIKHVAPPQIDSQGPLQLQISALDYDTYVGVIGIGRISRGHITPNTRVQLVSAEGQQRSARVLKVMSFLGLQRIEVEQATAGDIICITGIDPLNISDTLCDSDCVESLPPLAVDQPTLSMTFQVNDSPFAGQDGDYLTSRQLQARLTRELLHNVALKVEPTDSPDCFKVSGRGELHLSVLIETMRREGYELGVSRPQVVLQEVDGALQEPYEELFIDLEEQHQGRVMETLGARKAELQTMLPDGQGRLRLEYIVPARGLIGLRNEFLSLTSGTGIMNHNFSHYGPVKSGSVGQRQQGVLVSMVTGKTLAYALFNLQERGRLLVEPNTEVYEGMIVGLHQRANDLVVNPTKAKQLTNIRAAGSDENIILTPPLKLSLEQALTFIDDDELVEITPKHIRLRKKLLKEHQRRRAGKQ